MKFRAMRMDTSWRFPVAGLYARSAPVALFQQRVSLLAGLRLLPGR